MIIFNDNANHINYLYKSMTNIYIKINLTRYLKKLK